MKDWSPIKYMGFYDVPLVFITRYQGKTYLFDCPFDEELEDDSEFYKVYVLPDLRDEDLPKDWTTLHTRATSYLGEVPVVRVVFDPSKRQGIDPALFEKVSARRVAS